jgi:hypothetical protein
MSVNCTCGGISVTTAISCGLYGCLLHLARGNEAVARIEVLRCGCRAEAEAEGVWISERLPAGVLLSDLKPEMMGPIPATDDTGNPEIRGNLFDNREV